MKYSRLSKEQFEELHLEFANFLASQSIDKTEWDEIKASRPHVAEQELDLFSDLIWEGVLSSTEYLRQISSSHLFLFKVAEDFVHVIIIEVSGGIDIQTEKGWNWLCQNLTSDSVQISTGKKSLSPDRNQILFDLIRQGAIPTNGDIYNQISDLL